MEHTNKPEHLKLIKNQNFWIMLIQFIMLQKNLELRESQPEIRLKNIHQN